jgi:hypothetical protein
MRTYQTVTHTPGGFSGTRIFPREALDLVFEREE